MKDAECLKFIQIFFFLSLFVVRPSNICYNISTESQKTKRRPALLGGETLQTKERRVMQMITYTDFFQFCTFVISLVGVCYTIFSKRK